MEIVKQQNKMNCRLLMFPAPFQGHVTPMMHLANLLYYKGFSITVIQSTYNPINPTNFPSLTFHSLDDGLCEAYSKCPPPDSFKAIADMNSACKEPFRDCISLILKDAAAATDQDPVTCLIADPMFTFAGVVADSFNLPRIALRTGGMSSYVVYLSLSSLHEKGYFPLDETKLDDPVLEFPPLKIKDLPPETHHHLLTNVLNETNTSQGIICNSFEELEDASIARLQQTLPFPIFPIGPIHKYQPASQVSIWTEDKTSIAWLNTKAPKSVLYVSFGSVAAISEADFLEVAWGLADSEQPFLWVVRTGLIQGSDNSYTLPEGYKDIVSKRGYIVRWAPQAEVLSHPAVGGFWTHSGWNSTMESISEGVPMLCLPFFGDQSMNARYVSEEWKIGLQLEKGMKREDITKAIRKLMVEEDGEEMRNRVTALKEKADLCLTEGHSSYKYLDELISYLLAL
ncbi:UDP-glycosyltransferase 76B1-like [Silene latifolia]|uniref:UDP-glycosyltransferase 76B1-like n=1 Tax=Silene latifolia TaxID=37657 RepID=UPI003D77B421